VVADRATGTRPPERARAAAATRTRHVGLGIALLVLLGVAGLVVIRILKGELGEQALGVGSALALLPVVPVTFALLWLDRWEPEPTRYLLLAFAWGATGAALIAIIINSTLNVALGMIYDPTTGDDITAVVVAPVVEEAAKGAFVVAFWLLRRHEFDGIVDGIVLAGFSALGFAFTENILYFGRAYLDGVASSGAEGGVVLSAGTFLVRGIFSPFAHPLFTAMTGLGVAVAAASTRRSTRVIAPLVGFLVAVVLHALWNGSALLGDAFLFVYPFVMVPVFALAVGLGVWSRQREGRLLARHLPTYVAAGWLAPYEVPLLASLSTRRRLRDDAERVGGPAMRRATTEYHEAATELAFMRERVLHGTAGLDSTAHQAELLQKLADRRTNAFIPPPTPPPAVHW